MGEIDPHEVLKEKGLLVEFREPMGKAAFVSHQWVGNQHPDPEFKQMRVLQEALKRMTSDLSHISLDLNSEAMVPGAKPLDTRELRENAIFVWYDYFSCPQLDHQTRRALTKGLAHELNSELSKAIDSIPAYIARRELSEESSWILIRGATEIELVASGVGAGGGGAPPGEGDFTVPGDRDKLAPILQHGLRRKLFSYLKKQDLVSYRVLLNLQSTHMKGFDVERIEDLIPGFEPDSSDLDSASMAASRFLHENGFQSVGELDRQGWSPLHYAALGGHPEVIQGLLQKRADVNIQTKTGVFGEEERPMAARNAALGVSPCRFRIFKHHDAARLLVAARARVDGGILPALNLAGSANNPEGVRILCEAGCDARTTKDILGFSALEAACAQGSIEAVEEILRQAGYNMGSRVMNRSLYTAASFRGGKAELIFRLIELNSDVNTRYGPGVLTAHGAYLGWKTFQHRFGTVTNTTKQCYHAYKATPLMAAMMSAQYEGAAALVAAGAKLDLRNSRKFTAADFAEGHILPRFLAEALDGDVTACREIATAAIESSYFEI
ncbi:Ankyrin repeat and KH domain-containing protein 1 [Symbiodinium microadriaticum]|uniref:Ankyrin repeat and KH domain-containing protein 1 n=1 Tax=Symbiodinium microadriaticum TaxID=2951 RepID=A0A1Q9E6Q9_SYMMI|nr:Ankyrin repeat and KH domain-containing protein 1 [Symbiodinium microadriaticum]